MIITRTPFRISFFGGGTDYPQWFNEHGGAVLSTTFNKYCYITCRRLPPFFDHRYRIAYSQVEHACTLADIQHPAVQAVLREHEPTVGLEIHCDADLPARSGLGSSSSFVVGMLNSIMALRGQRVTKAWLAAEATRIEQHVLRETVGCQDQAAAAHGGLNIYRFTKDTPVAVEPVVLSSSRVKDFNDHLSLYFTGFSRIASAVAQAQVGQLSHKATELNAMHRMVDQAVDVLCSSADIRLIGEMLNDAWVLKRSLSDTISNASIDLIYQRARDAGALGGKLLGAGAGGFMLLFVEPRLREQVRDALSELVYVPFEFEHQGAQVIYFDPNTEQV
jgi:D-glycero-alpha-D-manno-heptose-7-phosphate kinase